MSHRHAHRSAVRKKRQRTAARRGMTLIELATSLALTSIILVALGSSVMVAAGALPTTQGESESRARQQIESMFLEISEAQRVSLSGPTAMRLLVPDRNSDGTPEEIIYYWMGLPSAVLVRAYNGIHETFIEGVQDFALELGTSPSVRTDVLKVEHEIVDSVNIRLGVSGDAVERSIRLVSRPPLLSGWVRTDFSRPPQTLDLDREAGADWGLLSGQINASDIEGGVWRSSGILALQSRWNFTEPTLLSFRVRPRDVNDSAAVRLIADVSALGVVEFLFDATILSGGTAMRLRTREVGLLSTRVLHQTSLTPGWVDVSLLVLPSSKKLRIFVNGEFIHEAGYLTKLTLLSSGQVQVSGNSSGVRWDYFDIRIGGQPQ